MNNDQDNKREAIHARLKELMAQKEQERKAEMLAQRNIAMMLSEMQSEADIWRR